ncbi:TonB-dependent receptor [Porphyromonadaceae bacterium W3.11]|nr:TonB-dependent receptor [Porphyromonadaceae bacterium W3.11]
MKRIYLIVLLFPLFVIGGFAQNALSIQGQLIDGDDEGAVIGATVRLLALPDSTVVKGMTSDMNGRFVFKDLKSGRYALRITSIGYDEWIQEVKLSNKSLKLGKIKMEQSATFLNEVTVTGQASNVTLKQDTIQFNSDAFRVQKGANVEDLLRRIPGMEIDDNGNISYNGEDIERVELDGRNFFSGDPRMATRNLPSDMIQNVQVVDKKSDESRLTGMNDGEKTKVLNLVVKEDKKGGIIANANAGYGTEERYKTDALVNIFDKDARYTILGNINNIDGVRRGQGDRTTRRFGGNYDNKWGEKLHLTSELYYSDNDDKKYGDNRTEQLLGGVERNIENEVYDDFNNAKRANFNTRIEWTPQEQTMFVIEPDLDWSRSEDRSASEFTTTNNDGDVINKGNALQTNLYSEYNASAVVHFRHTLNELGRNIYTRVWGNYTKGDGEGLNQSNTDFLMTGQKKVLDQRTNKDDENFYIGTNLAYLEPFNKHWALQLNYRVDYQKRDNEQMAYNKDGEDSYTILDEEYSRGTWNSNINHRFGVQMRYSFWGLSQLYVGMQANPTTTHTISKQGLTETFNQQRTVWNYSPSMILELKPNKAFSLNLRYMGRTRHPSMQQLNPATIVLSPLSQTKGNPDLLPSFVHSVWLSSFYNDVKTRRNFRINVAWNYTKDGVAAVQVFDKDTGARTTTYENVNGNQMVHGGFMVNTPLGGASSKFSSTTYGHVLYNKDIGFVNGVENTSHVFRPNLSERLSWRGDQIQATLGGSWGMQRVLNSFSEEQNRLTQDYNVFGEVIWELPWNLSVTSRLTYQDANGYDDGLKRDFWLWDASINWSFLKDKNASIELSGFDILRQRTSLQRRVTANAITDTKVNGVMSYMMLTFSYRFNNMGGNKVGASQSENQRGGRYGGRGYH